MKTYDWTMVLFGTSIICFTLLLGMFTFFNEELSAFEVKRVDGFCDLAPIGGCINRGCLKYFEKGGKCIYESGGCDCVEK